MSSTGRVLVLVREAAEFASIASVLSPQGVQPVACEDLLEAVLQQCDSPARLTICDADEYDWRQVLSVLTAVMPARNIVFISRAANDRLWMEMMGEGVSDLMEKPWSPVQLRWVLARALNHRASSATVA